VKPPQGSGPGDESAGATRQEPNQKGTSLMTEIVPTTESGHVAQPPNVAKGKRVWTRIRCSCGWATKWYVDAARAERDIKVHIEAKAGAR